MLKKLVQIAAVAALVMGIGAASWTEPAAAGRGGGVAARQSRPAWLWVPYSVLALPAPTPVRVTTPWDLDAIGGRASAIMSAAAAGIIVLASISAAAVSIAAGVPRSAIDSGRVVDICHGATHGVAP